MGEPPTPSKMVQLALGLAIIVSILQPAWAQPQDATLSGTVTNPSGAVVPNASVSVKNVSSGQTTEAQTNSAGLYSVPNLMPGDYEVSASADGFLSSTDKVTLAAGATAKIDVALTS